MGTWWWSMPGSAFVIGCKSVGYNEKWRETVTFYRLVLVDILLPCLNKDTIKWDSITNCHGRQTAAGELVTTFDVAHQWQTMGFLKRAKVAQSGGKKSTIHHLLNSATQLQKEEKSPFAELRLTVSLLPSDDLLFCCFCHNLTTFAAVHCLVSPEKSSMCETAVEVQVEERMRENMMDAVLQY